LAGGIIPGFARSIVTPSRHAEELGVGITAVVGAMLVPPRSATTGCIVPGAGPLGMSGVESGSAAPLVGGPPGVVLHTVADALPRGDAGDMVPVVLMAIGVGMVPRAVPGVIVVDKPVADDVIVAVLPALNVGVVPDIVDGAGVVPAAGGADTTVPGANDCDGMVEPGKSVRNDVAGVADSGSGAVELPAADAGDTAGTEAVTGGIVPLSADMDATGTGAVPGPVCPVGVEQVTTVPGVVGSDANGTGASVVTAVPGWVIAENGLGPLSGDDTIAPGVVGRPMAVLPMVETCAEQAPAPASKIAIVANIKRCIAMISSVGSSSSAAYPCESRPWRLPPGSPSD
jgi:hypothetical protein